MSLLKNVKQDQKMAEDRKVKDTENGLVCLEWDVIENKWSNVWWPSLYLTSF